MSLGTGEGVRLHAGAVAEPMQTRVLLGVNAAVSLAFDVTATLVGGNVPGWIGVP